MIWTINILLLLLIVISAFVAINSKDLLSAAVVLGIFSFLMCLLWAEMQAVDVSFTEAAVGAGASTVFLIATVFKTSRKTSD